MGEPVATDMCIIACHSKIKVFEIDMVGLDYNEKNKMNLCQIDKPLLWIKYN